MQQPIGNPQASRADYQQHSVRSARIQPLLQTNGTVSRKYARESEGAEQDGEDIKAPNQGGQDECEQHRSYDAYVSGTGHALLGFFRKKEMDKPGEQHA